ncbi:hypothetical protein [Sphingomonas sp.]|uniref:hypothetical protein n=1 Tax=Sphingomonas sp. TaxID=28214 RepID=UPI002C93CA2F|nr:hypothetical protein [Sphingomonas sp.]HTG38030.1 hypothetical protein [Sphingomonas sp.]
MDIPGIYHDWIMWIGDGTGLPDAILHIHAGMAVLLAVRLMTRQSLGSFIPFAAVVAAELGNELLDYLHYGLRVDDTLADIGNPAAPDRRTRCRQARLNAPRFSACGAVRSPGPGQGAAPAVRASSHRSGKPAVRQGSSQLCARISDRRPKTGSS